MGGYPYMEEAGFDRSNGDESWLSRLETTNNLVFVPLHLSVFNIYSSIRWVDSISHMLLEGF